MIIGITPSIIIIIINLVVLCLFLNKFLYKPVNNIIEKRQEAVTGALTDAENSKEEAYKLKSDYEEELKQASVQASAIVKEAKERAEIEYNKRMKDAKADADQMMAEASKAIELEKKKSMESAQAEIATVALLAASKILSKNVDTTANQQFIGEFLKEVGAAK